MLYSSGTVLEGGIGYRWKALDQENTVDGEPSPSPCSSIFAASLLHHDRVVIVMEEVDIFISRSPFSGSLRKFLELMGVSGNDDCGVILQQYPVRNTSCVPQAAGENRGEACVRDGRASEQLAVHICAGSRQRIGWRYRR